MEEQIYNVAIERYGIRFVNRLLSLDVSKDKHYILMICNLFSEYNDYDKVRNTISRYNQIEQYLDSSEAQKYDKYSGDIDIDIAVGTFRMGNNPNALKNCQIFYDEGICIYSPKSFAEASAIGGRLWEFCADEEIFQKMKASGVNLYFTYNALANYTIDYVAAIAKSNGYVDAYSKNGSRLNRQEYAQWKEGLSSAFALLKPSNSNENKQYKTNTNMNKKLIRLTEGDLHKIVKESVNRVLNESKYEEGYDSGQFLCQTQVEMYGEEAAKEKIRKELEIREYWAEENRKNRRTQDPFKKGEADALADWLMSSMGAEGTTFKR